MFEVGGVNNTLGTDWGGLYSALGDLSLSIQPGEFVAVVGPTGSGKSTTLGLIAGLERATGGEVFVMGQPVQGVNPRVGFVFQTDAVFPWKSVLGNVTAGPQFRGLRRQEAQRQARDWIARVGLAGFEDRYPH